MVRMGLHISEVIILKISELVLKARYILDPSNVASCDEPHRLRQCKLLCNFYTSSPDCSVQDC